MLKKITNLKSLSFRLQWTKLIHPMHGLYMISDHLGVTYPPSILASCLASKAEGLEWGLTVFSWLETPAPGVGGWDEEKPGFGRTGSEGLGDTNSFAGGTEVLWSRLSKWDLGGRMEEADQPLLLPPTNSLGLKSFCCFAKDAPQSLKSWSAAPTVMLYIQTPQTQHCTTTFDFHADMRRTAWGYCSSWPQLDWTLSLRLDPALHHVGLIHLGP